MILVFVTYVFARLGLVGPMEAVGWSEVKLRPLEVATPKPDDPLSGHCDLQTQKTTTTFLFITTPRFLAQIPPNLQWI